MEQFAEAINKLLDMVEKLQSDVKFLNVQIGYEKDRIIRLEQELAKAKAPKA